MFADGGEQLWAQHVLEVISCMLSCFILTAQVERQTVTSFHFLVKFVNIEDLCLSTVEVIQMFLV